MFNSGILDVAIGLIFLYLLLSLICSAVNELIESKLRMRAKDLERGLRDLLYDEKGILVQTLINHPLIFGKKIPSYISARCFALALMDTISPATESHVSGAAYATIAPGSSKESFSESLPSLRNTISRITPDKSFLNNQVQQTLLSMVDTAGNDVHQVRDNIEQWFNRARETFHQSLPSLRDAITRKPLNPEIINTKVRQALLSMIDAAGNDVGQVRDNIEQWFNSAMDRVSGWYKRRTQWIILALGLVIAIVLNADTITIARSLYMDKAMRELLVAATLEYTAKTSASPLLDVKTDAKKILEEKLQQLSMERKMRESLTAAISEYTAKTSIQPPVDAKTDEKNILSEKLQQFQKLSLPIGWVSDDSRSIPKGTGSWLIKILGWLLTATAISVGAPFWFDFLNKFINIRSSIKPPEKTSGT